MSKKPRLKAEELSTIAAAEYACRSKDGKVGGTAEEILKRYNELISPESEARAISKSSIEHKLADWRRDGRIPPSKANLPTEERPLDLETPWTLDQPWDLGTLDKFHIAAEALPSVLKAWGYCREKGNPLTIREAKWVARFYPLSLDIDILVSLAWSYSFFELTLEITGGSADWDGFEVELYEYLIGEELSEERRDKILQAKETSPVITRQRIRRLVSRLGKGSKVSGFSGLRWRTRALDTSENAKEAQNEGSHNQEG